MKKFNIITPVYKNTVYQLERLLNSLEDQDFSDFDITFVLDGPDKKIKDFLVERVVDNDRNKIFPIKIEEIPHGGASNARNYGAQISGEDIQFGAGDILLFLDADCSLYPGILSEFKRQFEKNQKIDFIYGNYRFENNTEFFSMPFDPYQLETMNYIPTMSPIKRSVFNEFKFNESLPYFQDWGLFYKAAKAGYVGFYLNEFIFKTDLPKKNSISGIKGSLDSKAKRFRVEHNIPDKRLVTTTFSSPLQAIQRAKILGADYVGPADGSRRSIYPSNLAFSNWDGCYMVGAFNYPIEAFQNHIMAMSGVERIFHFVGTDVFQLINQHTNQYSKAIRDMLIAQEAHVFANSIRLVDELKSVDIQAELLYSPIYNIKQYKADPLPKKYTVAVYYKDDHLLHSLENNGGYSNNYLIFEIAKIMKDVDFKFFGGKAVEKKDNIEFCGQIPPEKMVDFINSCSILVRSTIHDGLPHLPIQFMLCGRSVLVSSPDPELKYVNRLSFEDIKNYTSAKSELIDKIYAMEGKPLLNTDHIYGYYSALLDENYYKERIYKCLEKKDKK